VPEAALVGPPDPRALVVNIDLIHPALRRADSSSWPSLVGGERVFRRHRRRWNREEFEALARPSRPLPSG